MCTQAGARWFACLRGGVVIACLCGGGLIVLLTVLVLPTKAFSGVQGAAGSVRQDTKAEFAAACSVLPEVLAAPLLSNITISPVRGGELRLQPTLEDYFDGSEIDASQWISGYSNPAFPAVAPPQIVDGAARLDANYLRALQPLGSEMPQRFFEASARFVIAPDPVAYTDLGFYRSQPPLRPVTETSSIRLFIAQTTVESATPRHMYVRSKDGLFIPEAPPAQDAVDTVVDNWGDNSAAQFAGLNQFRTYGIRWDQVGTQYLIDGSPIITAPVGESKPLPHAGVSTLPTYVFLYSQDPTFFGGGRSPLLVDWVRAGAYPSQGRYTSCVSDAGESVNWSRIAVSASVPAGTAVVIESRTSQDGEIWSNWAATDEIVSGVGVVSMRNPGGRYFQYRATLNTANPMDSPEVDLIQVSYYGPQSVRVIPEVVFINPNASFAFGAEVIDANDEAIPAYPTPVQWSVVSGGGTIDGDGMFTAGSASGRFTDTILATIPGLLAGRATVVIGNTPVVSVSVCCPGLEGIPITMTAVVEVDLAQVPYFFAWDLNNDGDYDDATGEEVVHIFPKKGEYPVRLLTTNSLGFTSTAQTIATILNVAPQIVAINTNTPVQPREEVTVEVIAVDVPADTLTYSFDLNNNGDFDITDSDSNRATTTFDTPGDQLITVRVRDDDGGETLGSTIVRVNPYRVFLPLTARQ